MHRFGSLPRRLYVLLEEDLFPPAEPVEDLSPLELQRESMKEFLEGKYGQTTTVYCED